MRITDLKTFVVGNPWKNWVFVKVYTDAGLVGLGEATGGLATKPSLGDLEELRRVRSHEGRRRQLQYVGKLMRTQDVEPLAQAVAQAQLGSARETLRLHRLEALRQELVSDDAALTRFMAEHPDCDAQPLRALIRNARREAALPPEQRHGRAWRELFQFLKPFSA